MSVTLRGVTDVDTPDAPLRLADMAPRRRAPVLLLLLLAAALIAGGTVAFVATRGETPAAHAEPSSPPTSAAVLLTEHDTCLRLNPPLRRASEMYAAYVKDGTTPTRDEASSLRAELREVQKVAYPDMSPHIGQVMKGVSLLPAGGAGINFQDWQYAESNLAKRCLGVI